MYPKPTVGALDGRTNVSGTHLNIEDGPLGELQEAVHNRAYRDVFTACWCGYTGLRRLTA